eukprot:m.8318 g.8318  ORF g.8318 m.8318 type:complete len:53 (-) comp4048_c0_seq1:1164-1322(-)
MKRHMKEQEEYIADMEARHAEVTAAKAAGDHATQHVFSANSTVRWPGSPRCK